MHALPRLSGSTALFLDFDGTLVDIAAQPELVHIPPQLPLLLQTLQTRLGGALAIVTGRQIADIDQFLAPLRLPIAGEHGARRRDAAGMLFAVDAPDLRPITAAAQQLADQHPGLRVERKEAAVALHYRHAPTLEAVCRNTMRTAVQHVPGVVLLHGKCVFEAKPAAVDKGQAIKALMQEAPFAGRVPVFAGDDVTDEAGFSAVAEIHGSGIKVGAGPTFATHRCDNPAALLAWLEAAVAEAATSHTHASGRSPA